MTASTTASRAQLAEELLGLFPLIRRRIESNLPEAVRTKLADATPHQMEAVGCLLHGQSQGLTMHELAEKQGCALSTATALADRLLRAGLVERVDDPDDRRIVRLVPTAKAKELKQYFLEAKRQSVLQVLNGLSVEELQNLIALLRKVATASETDKEAANV